MIGRLTQYGSRLLLARVLTPDVVGDLDEVYLALTLALATDASDGQSLAEPRPQDGYGRAYYPVGSQYWTDAGFGTFWNVDKAVFPPATNRWRRIAGFAICTTPSGGDVLAFGPSSITEVPSGGQLSVQPGQIQIKIKGAAL